MLVVSQEKKVPPPPPSDYSLNSFTLVLVPQCRHILTLPLCVLMLLIVPLLFSVAFSVISFHIFPLGTFSMMMSQKTLSQLYVFVPVQLHTTS